MSAAWLSRNLLVLTLVSLAQDAASELLYPLLPLFLVGTLAAPPVVVGVVEGAAEAAAGVSKYFAGRWSDGRRRRPFVTAGYGMAAVGKVIVAAEWLCRGAGGRVVDRLGKGVQQPARRIDRCFRSRLRLRRAFGFHRAGDSLGAVSDP